MQNLQQKTVSGIKWTSLSAMLKFSLQIAQVLILARCLSQEELGLYSILLVIAGISQIFSDMGISLGLIHFQNLNQRQLNTLYWLNILAGIAVFVFWLLMAWGVAMFYEEARLVPLIHVLALTFLIRPIGQQFQYLFQKQLRFKIIALTEVLAELTALLVLLYLLFSGWGIFAVPWAIVASASVYAAILLKQGLKIYKPKLGKLYLKECRECLQFGLYQMGERALNYLSVNLDKIIIGKFFGMQWLGAYELAHQLLIRPLSLISLINGRVAFPVFAKIQTDYKLLNQWYLQNINFFTLLAFPVYFGLLGIAPELIEFLFGAGWELSVESFYIIGWLGLIWSIGNPIGAYLLALGRADYGFFMNIYQICIYSIALLIGSFYFDFVGMLWTYVILTTVFMMPLDYWIRWRLTKMGIVPHLKIWIKNCLLAGIMFVSLILIRWYLSNFELHYLAKLLIYIPFGLGVYLFLFRILAKDQFEIIVSTFRKSK